MDKTEAMRLSDRLLLATMTLKAVRANEPLDRVRIDKAITAMLGVVDALALEQIP